MKEKDSKGLPGSMKILVVEGPPAKNIASMNYLGYHTATIGLPARINEDGIIENIHPVHEDDERSYSSCEENWLIGCCIIHPL